MYPRRTMPSNQGQVGASGEETATPGNGDGRLVDAAEVAAIIGMRTDYVYALCRQDATPHLRFGRTLRFRQEAVRSWLVESERGAGGEASSEAGSGRRRHLDNSGA